MEEEGATDLLHKGGGGGQQACYIKEEEGGQQACYIKEEEGGQQASWFSKIFLAHWYLHMRGFFMMAGPVGTKIH